MPCVEVMSCYNNVALRKKKMILIESVVFGGQIFLNNVRWCLMFALMTG